MYYVRLRRNATRRRVVISRKAMPANTHYTRNIARVDKAIPHTFISAVDLIPLESVAFVAHEDAVIPLAD